VILAMLLGVLKVLLRGTVPVFLSTRRVPVPVPTDIHSATDFNATIVQP
jgi:hypothetical protein